MGNYTSKNIGNKLKLRKKSCTSPLITRNHTRKINGNLELKLRKNFSVSSFQSDLFEELSLEVAKQKKFKKMPWIPYINFKEIMYINEDGYLNCSARLKSKSIRIKDIKILLKEIINSEKLSQDELKLIAAELEYNDKKNSTEILGISQNPFTLNYIIVVDFLFSGNLYI
ncbi:uncharacterized protein OCT59_026175 [Rhizophagus irregularis]|uniref:Uncharacterized protein n=2 Tax=Rhizophagus irregularis TaxID=588596 RepID=A0A2P4QCM9_RHIID|nr:hypothetical protein GLOIN_2v1872910 [Rhizophagus irregularis DAOM 181602=DAOM 197198]POG75396.1 hypothetical protein GLOIN_2v1872910 [Rhizophagus irregularis DAOM 181602=DAOM 197198]UZO05836.1 hypothetical protein OCT59_026175 [Rhizophagus irregularis]|eukprot:XP_025182262.1 hypothetical protein GLOIN_2v1872910 [Rhizophagus irregularis DAOM 181602=DAOM 197198]